MRHEIEFGLEPRGKLCAGDDFRHMPMTQGTVAVEIAVPMGMMGAFDRFAPRTGAAGDAGHEQTQVGQPQRQQGHAGEQRRGCEASGMRDVRRGRFLQVLRDGAGKLPNSRRRAVCMLVHGLIGGGTRIAEVGRDVDAVHARARRLGGGEQSIDDGGGNAVGRRGEQGAARRAPYQCLDLVEIDEFQLRIGSA